MSLIVVLLVVLLSSDAIMSQTDVFPTSWVRLPDSRFNVSYSSNDSNDSLSETSSKALRLSRFFVNLKDGGEVFVIDALHIYSAPRPSQRSECPMVGWNRRCGRSDVRL